MPSTFSTRHGDRLYTRECSTPTCPNTTTAMNGMCWTCIGHLRRFGHPQQTLPTTAELDKFIRAAEEQRGRLKHLDLEALEARWVSLVDDCRARATPSYKDQKVLSYNGWEREASALIRDIAESITFTRALDLLTGLLLMNLQRPHAFKSDSSGSNEDALACSMVELMRRAAHVGSKVVAMNTANGTIARSYRRELSRNSRLACARLLMVGLGAAAAALAKRASQQEAESKRVSASYYDVVRSLASA
jgi:hypothetical protein